MFAALHRLFSSGERGPLYLFLSLSAAGVRRFGTGFSLVVSGGRSSLWWTGFSCCGTRAWQAGFSHCGSWALERGLGNRGAQAQLLCRVWTLPGLGMEPVSPAVEGGFLATTPPGKFPQFSLILDLHISD